MLAVYVRSCPALLNALPSYVPLAGGRYLGSYLVAQGYNPSDLTYLSAYVSQIRVMRKMMRDFPELQGGQCKTVDNFQVKRLFSSMSSGVLWHRRRCSMGAVWEVHGYVS